jgi:hypothetical protein
MNVWDMVVEIRRESKSWIFFGRLIEFVIALDLWPYKKRSSLGL